MSGELNQEILDELKKINQKIDSIGEQRGITTPLKFIAIIAGFNSKSADDDDCIPDYK